ncbi:unnamed protein product, partial [Polarella glacialis]
MDDASNGGNELANALNRRKLRSEAQGAVFEVAGVTSNTDVTWDQHMDTQFTPRGAARGSPRLLAKELTGTTAGQKPHADGDVNASAMTSESHGDDNASEATVTDGDQDEVRELPNIPADTLSAADIDLSVVIKRSDLPMDIEDRAIQRDQDETATQPASPARTCSPVDAEAEPRKGPQEQVEELAGQLAGKLEHSFAWGSSSAPARQGAEEDELQAPGDSSVLEAVAALVPAGRQGTTDEKAWQEQEQEQETVPEQVEDVLSMSSSSYFRPYQQRGSVASTSDPLAMSMGAAPALKTQNQLSMEMQWQQQQALLQQRQMQQQKLIEQQQPFPRARGEVRPSIPAFA